ncbi:MAG: dipeptide ABC transporter ATP-binding protein [Brevibacterium sp.]
MTEPLLQISDLNIAFTVDKKKIPVVHDVSVTVYPGQTVAIVGESGSGKSTTAHAIIDLLPGTGEVTSGSITFEGENLLALGRAGMSKVRGSEIGLIPQDPMSNLNPLYKVGAQIKEVVEVNSVASGHAAQDRVVELLEEAGLSNAAARAKQYPHEFSGGMRQRALIAAGLAARPKLLIADEPTSALDVTVQRQILDHMKGLTDELGVAMLLITHDLGLAAERADHLIVMYKGRVVESGPALTILQDPQHPYSKRLISSAPSLQNHRSTVEERAEVRESAETTAVQVIEEEEHVSEFVAEASAPVISVRELTKVFKIPQGAFGRKVDFTAVDRVSFDLDRGTTTAIVGESGSGKSTVARMVLDLLQPSRGSVEFDGVNLDSIKGRRAQLDFRRRVQPVFQNPYASLDPMYPVFRSIEEPLRLHGIGSTQSREKKVRDLLDKVSMPATVMTRYPNELSGGQRQRVAIARALALDPEAVVLDEAVSALDVLVQAQILGLLGELQAELGLSYLFISHDLAVVKQIADQVVVMEKGVVVEQAKTATVFEQPREDYTRKLLQAIPGRNIDLAS